MVAYGILGYWEAESCPIIMTVMRALVYSLLPQLLTGNTIRSTSVKGCVPHEAIEILKDLPMAQNLLAVLVQYQRGAKTELMSAAGMQHDAKVTQQLQETLRVLLAPVASQNDTSEA